MLKPEMTKFHHSVSKEVSKYDSEIDLNVINVQNVNEQFSRGGNSDRNQNR